MAIGELERYAAGQRDALAARDAPRADAARLATLLHEGQAGTDDGVPGLGFWELPDAELHCAAPWNGGAFRAARDQLFIASIRLHRTFIVAAARTIKPSLNAIARAAQGGSDAPKPTMADWGAFFLLVPVASTTFASIGRMFPGVGAGEIGWLLIDEAGQAPPQAAVGALCRAQRAARLRAMLPGTPGLLPGLSRTERREWIERRVGTVHTFQGKEAEAVILMLGAGRGAEAGSRTGAGATPNLLNVAAARAKRVLHVVGNRTEWRSAGVFAVAAEALEPWSPREWLGLGQLVPAESPP